MMVSSLRADRVFFIAWPDAVRVSESQSELPGGVAVGSIGRRCAASDRAIIAGAWHSRRQVLVVHTGIGIGILLLS